MIEAIFYPTWNFGESFGDFLAIIYLPAAVSQESGLKEVLYCIIKAMIGAMFSPVGCQTTVASLALHSAHLKLGALGTS